MDLSIVLVNWNGKVLVHQCVDSLERSGTRCTYEIIISDNASTDGSQEWLHRLEQQNPRVRCVYGAENAGFGVGNNRALPYCQGRYVLFLNSDTVVLEPLDALVAAADDLGSECGAVGGRVLNADRSLQLTARERYTVPILVAGLTSAFMGNRSRSVRKQELEVWDHATVREVAMLSGCALLVPRAVLDQVGGFDPHFFHFFEDSDLCYRIRAAGYRVCFAPVSSIMHLDGGSSRSAGLSARVLSAGAWSARYFARKHLGKMRARRLAVEVWCSWFMMWCVMAPLGMLIPLRSLRASSRRRAKLLWAILHALPRQRFP